LTLPGAFTGKSFGTAGADSDNADLLIDLLIVTGLL